MNSFITPVTAGFKGGIRFGIDLLVAPFRAVFDVIVAFISPSEPEPKKPRSVMSQYGRVFSKSSKNTTTTFHDRSQSSQTGKSQTKNTKRPREMA